MSNSAQFEPASTSSGDAADKPVTFSWRNWVHSDAACSLRELGILCVVTALLLFYGLVPFRAGHVIVSSPEIGLVGADEPRYAQIAAEMLQQHSDVCHQLHATVIPHALRLETLHHSMMCAEAGVVTPILYGHPWLEKPALYYWRTMSFYKEFGFSDWVARLPSATGAYALVFLIFLHMRRFRPGGHLDAALITASAAAIIAFARGASTDMQLAAPFCIGMLGWYAWYETGKKFWLFDLYFFGGLATLAKGPVAIVLSLSIIVLFVGLRREWRVLQRMIWWPGILLFSAIVLPWFVAVQLRNPTFYKFFLWQQNLERFATNRYQHHQNPFFYVIVLLLALMPWTVLAGRALWDSISIAAAEWRVRHHPVRYLGHARAGDAFPEFLVLWTLFPVVFFSFSGSKLPGYILPAIPPLTILTGDYLHRVRRAGLPLWLLIAHGVTAALLTFVLLLCPQYMVYQRFVPPARTLLPALLIALAFGSAIVLLVRRLGLKWIRSLTLVPVMSLLFFLLHGNGWLLDANYSARPLARQIAAMAPDVPLLATYHIRRDTDYGLAFYRGQPLRHYLQEISATEKNAVIAGVPKEEHILVLRTDDTEAISRFVPHRRIQRLLVDDWQGLAVYRVGALQETPGLQQAPVHHRLR